MAEAYRQPTEPEPTRRPSTSIPVPPRTFARKMPTAGTMHDEVDDGVGDGQRGQEADRDAR
jgi:hypothetical protein